MNRRAAALLAGVIALASCGGGGESGGGGGIGAAPTPSPTPAPSPTPLPSPSASATPAPVYPTYAQLTGNQTFQTGCAALSMTGSPFPVFPTSAFGSGVTLAYEAGTQAYTASSDTVFPFGPARGFGPADRDPAAPAQVVGFVRTTNGFVERLSIGIPNASGSSPDYVRGLSLRVPLNGDARPGGIAVQYACFFGVPTRSTDLPAGQIAFGRTGFNGVAYVTAPGEAQEAYSVQGSQVSFALDTATNRVAATIRVIGILQTANGPATTTTDLGTYIGTAGIDARGFYNGALISGDREITGAASFGGWFFGPQAAEAGFNVGVYARDPATDRRISLIGNAIALR